MKRRLSVKSRVLTGALLSVSLFVGTASVAVGDTAVSSPVVGDGVYVITSAMDDKKALDVNAESKNNGANVQLWDRNDGNGQRFRVTNLGDNEYSIINEYSGKALDIDGGSKKAGANVHQWTWSNSDNQRFTIEPAKNGGYTIKAVSSGLFLDVKGSRTTNGTNVIQWAGNGGKANQRWNLNSMTSFASLVCAGDREILNVPSEVEVEYVEYEEPDWDEIERTINSVERLEGDSEKAEVAKAKKVNYQPRSCSEMVWEKATAYRYSGEILVTVPLKSELEEVNQVVFTWEDGKVHTQEVFGEMMGEVETHVRVWTDGVLGIERYVVDNEPNVETRGVSWSKFKKCFKNSGGSATAFAVIESACAVGAYFTGPYGAAACVGLYAGMNFSIVLNCVYKAWV